MRKIYYGIKASLKRSSTWIVIASLVLLTAVFMGISIPDGNGTKLGIISGESKRAEEIIEKIKESDSIYEIVRYDDREELVKDLKKGITECGFVFASDFDANIEKGRLKGQIEYISSPYTTKGLVAREVVFAAFLKEYGRDILDEKFPELFEGVSDETDDVGISEFMHNSYAKYLESTDIFTVDFR